MRTESKQLFLILLPGGSVLYIREWQQPPLPPPPPPLVFAFRWRLAVAVAVVVVDNPVVVLTRRIGTWHLALGTPRSASP
jgi:hypothetical protein